MTFQIDGVDFSRNIYRYGFTVQYEKVYGKNGGQMLDGTEVVDLVRVRKVLTAACNPLTSAQLSTLEEVCRREYVAVRYTDPAEGGDVRIDAVPSLSVVNKSLVSNGVTHWTDAVITLRER